MVEKKTYGTGRRKRATARVWVKPGTGKLIINNKDAAGYFKTSTMLKMVKDPLVLTNSAENLDVYATIIGGGLNGQAGALRHGITRALVLYNADFKDALKKAGFLTRDPREVERKKYGRPKARKRFQFSKR